MPIIMISHWWWQSWFLCHHRKGLARLLLLNCEKVLWDCGPITTSEGASMTSHAPPFTQEPTTMVPKYTLGCPQTQSHLFPRQPLGCTGVITLCARIPPCVQPAADWGHLTNALPKSLVHYCFMAQWPKCILKFVCWFLLHQLEQTDTKFNYSLTLGEGLCADIESRVSERWQKTTICPIFIIWHISIAYFGSILFQIIA